MGKDRCTCSGAVVPKKKPTCKTITVKAQKQDEQMPTGTRLACEARVETRKIERLKLEASKRKEKRVKHECSHVGQSHTWTKSRRHSWYAKRDWQCSKCMHVPVRPRRFQPTTRVLS